MGNDEKRMEFFTDRWRNEREPLLSRLPKWVRSYTKEEIEDRLLREIIPSAETIKQALEFPLLMDQILFLKSAHKSYRDIFENMIEVQFVFENKRLGSGQIFESEESKKTFEISHNVHQILRKYMYDVYELLRKKIKELYIAKTQKAVHDRNDKNQIDEGNEERRYQQYPDDKMHWMGTEKQLITLFEMLMNKNLILIEENRKWETLAQHFMNRDGNPFKPKQLSTVAQRTSPSEGKVIQIVHEIAKESSE